MGLARQDLHSGTTLFRGTRSSSRGWLTVLTLVLPGVWSLSGCSEGTDADSTSTGGNGSTEETGGAEGTELPGAGGSSTGGSATGAGGAGSGGTASGGAASTGGAEGSGSSNSSGGAEDVGGSGGMDAGSGGGENAAGGSDSAAGGGGNDSPLSPGCGTAFSPPPPSNQQQTLEIEGDTRYYLMDVPDDADNETPLMLIFGLHGFDMNNIAVVDLFNFTERSGGQAITVWPQGEGPHPGDVSHWGDQVLQSTWVGNEQNYAFLREIMDDLGERYCIDRDRTFIAGFSMGAFFTNQIACAHSDWFSGFAPVAGGRPQNCADDVQSAIMVQHGTEDEIVVLSSGEESRDFWLNQNGCGSTSTSSLNNCAFYDGCADNKPVAWCTGSYDHYIPDEVASNIWSFFSSL